MLPTKLLKFELFDVIGEVNFEDCQRIAIESEFYVRFRVKHFPFHTSHSEMHTAPYPLQLNNHDSFFLFFPLTIRGAHVFRAILVLIFHGAVCERLF